MRFKSIAISDNNYETLKRLGNIADSFNDVITDLMKKAGVKEEND